MLNNKIKHFFIHLYILFSIYTACYAQTIQDSHIIANTHETYAEKVYLQLDKNVYTSTETIWFKAIVLSALNHQPTALSSILHVELINPYKEIVDTRLLKLNDGISQSYFNLQNYKSGQYLIRAYTKWNNNFGQDFIFNQYVHVYETNEEINPVKAITLTKTNESKQQLNIQLDPLLVNNKYKGKLKAYLVFDEQKDSIEVKKDKTGYYNFDYLLPDNTKVATLQFSLDNLKTFSKTIALNKNAFDLQFLPEGGELVNGLKSTIGFKAVDYTGKGKAVSGNIIDNQGNVMSVFKSNHLGMGKVQFTPESSKQYYGTITGEKGEVFKFPFPKVLQTGTVMEVTEKGNKINLKLTSSNSFKNESISIRVRHRGVTQYYSKVSTEENFIKKNFDKKSLPNGIIEFTIFNNNIPICERLFFNYKKEELLNITIKPSKSSYRQRDKTKLNIEVTNSVNELVNASSSVLVLNKDQLGKMQKTRQNILSYFLLSSEIKREIENSGFYFRDEAKHEDMDVLMLTQGWRKYNYKDEKRAFKYQPEKSLVVSGKIGEVLNVKKEDQSVNLTLMTFGESVSLYEQQVDSTGIFNFNLNDTYGKNIEILLQSKNNKKGKIKDYTFNFDKNYIPEIKYNPQKKINVIDTIINAYVLKTIEQEKLVEALKKYHGTIELDEVFLDGYNLTPAREKMMELHGKPDVVIDDKELQEKIKKWSFGLYSILMFNYRDQVRVQRVGPGAGFLYANVHGADFTFVIIDGIPVKFRNYNLIQNLPPEEIKSVEIIKNPKNPAEYASDVFPYDVDKGVGTWSFLNVYTYSGKGLNGVEKTSGILKKRVPVFSIPREFYAPKYEKLTDQDWKTPDLRQLIYWDANLKSDNKGKFITEFYNTDTIGDVLIIIETITENGEIGYHEMTYKTEE